MKRVVGKLFLCFPLVLGMAAANYKADPAHIFRASQYTRTVAQFLLKGSNVANAGNYDGRLLQRHYVNGLSERKDVIVLGSSRAMQVRASLFPGKSVFNSSITQGSLRDYVAIYEMYAAKNLEPSMVVLRLDPWIFDRTNKRLDRLFTIDAEYQAGRQRLGLPAQPQTLSQRLDGATRRYFQLFSPAYLQSSVAYLAKPRPLHETKLEQGNVVIKLSDGSLSYEKKRQAKQAAAERRGHKFVQAPFGKIDPEAVAELEAFVDYLQKRKIEVVFLLAPYRPSQYKSMLADDDFRNLTEVEARLKSIASTRHIEIVGSYDPVKMGCSESDYFDPTHPNTACVARLFREHVSRYERENGMPSVLK
ncbi:MAG: hypothetical protein ABFD96_14010 [Armatimonadia bacterium]